MWFPSFRKKEKTLEEQLNEYLTDIDVYYAIFRVHKYLSCDYNIKYNEEYEQTDEQKKYKRDIYLLKSVSLKTVLNNDLYLDLDHVLSKLEYPPYDDIEKIKKNNGDIDITIKKIKNANSSNKILIDVCINKINNMSNYNNKLDQIINFKGCTGEKCVNTDTKNGRGCKSPFSFYNIIIIICVVMMIIGIIILCYTFITNQPSGYTPSGCKT